MEDEGMKGPFGDTESDEQVDHYHAHGKNCEDKGHSLKKDHTLPAEDTKEDRNEHSLPAEDTKEEKNDHEYPGMIRTIR